MQTAHRRQTHIITPCRSKSRLITSLAQFGIHQIEPTRHNSNNDIEIRATERLTALERRHQVNIEQIVQMTVERSEKLTSISHPDPDWLEHFLHFAKQSSHPRMQELWARVLLMESQSPSSFSVRALRVLADLTPYEAVILRKTKSFTFFDKQSNRHKIIIGYQQKPKIFGLLVPSPKLKQINIAHCGLNYPDILTLVDLGLLHGDLIESGILNPGRSLQLFQSQEQLTLTPQTKDLVLTYFRYTPVGEELCKLIPSKINSHYLEELQLQLQPKFNFQYDS